MMHKMGRITRHKPWRTTDFEPSEPHHFGDSENVIDKVGHQKIGGYLGETAPLGII